MHLLGKSAEIAASMRRLRGGLVRCSASGGLLVLTACAILPSGPPEELIKQRAGQRWRALIEHDYDKAYTYQTHGFQSLVKLQDYRGRFGSAAIWIDAEAAKVSCPSVERCTVSIRLEYRHGLLGKSKGTITTYFDETWVNEGGTWYIFESVKP